MELFLRGPLVAPSTIAEVCAALEATTTLRPKQFGWMETKRRSYDRQLASQYDAKKGSLLLWGTRGGPDPDFVELGDANPLAASFTRPWSDASGLVQDAQHLIETLRPVFVTLAPLFDWKALADEDPDLSARVQSIGSPSPPALVQRLGLGELPPASYVDDGLASSLGQAVLSSVGASRLASGYQVGRIDVATLSDVTGYLRQRLASHEVLRAHGLAGRVGQTPQMPTYYGPRWKAPQSWTRKLLAVAERRVAGPNV
jgi:hypothetical protein